MDLVLRAVHSKGKCKQGRPFLLRNVYSPHSHALFNVRWCNTVAKTNYEFSNLFDVDDILILLICSLLALDRTKWVDRAGTLSFRRIHGYDFGAAHYPKGMFLTHSLAIGGEIPEVRRGETCVRLLHACMA